MYLLFYSSRTILVHILSLAFLLIIIFIHIKAIQSKFSKFY